MNQNRTKKILLLPFGAVAATLTVTATAYACTAFLGTFEVKGGIVPTKVYVEGDDHNTNIDDPDNKGDKNAGCCWDMAQTVGAQEAQSSATVASDRKVRIRTGTTPLNPTLGALDPSSRLPDEFTDNPDVPIVYDVNFYNSAALTGPGYSTHSTWANDCMSGGLTYNRPNVDANNDGVYEATFVHRIGYVKVNDSGQIISQSNDGSTWTAVAAGDFTTLFDLPSALNKDDAPPADVRESAVCVSDPNFYFGNQAPLTIV